MRKNTTLEERSLQDCESNVQIKEQKENCGLRHWKGKKRNVEKLQHYENDENINTNKNPQKKYNKEKRKWETKCCKRTQDKGQSV